MRPEYLTGRRWILPKAANGYRFPEILIAHIMRIFHGAEPFGE
jgi:hypothetical protein